MEILLVDDSRVSMEATRIQLESLQVDFPHNLHTADNGMIAVSKSLECDYDLIIMDVEMPEMNGIEATEKILSFSPSARICLLTSLAGVEDFSRGRKAGCKHYLLKPVDVTQLRSILRIVQLRKEVTGK